MRRRLTWCSATYYAMQYYQARYLAGSTLQLLRLVLDKLASPRSSNVRASYFCLVWNQLSSGRKKGLFMSRGTNMSPLCDLSDSLDHVVLRCGFHAAPRSLGRCHAPILIRRRFCGRLSFGLHEENAGVPFRNYIKIALSTAVIWADRFILSMWVNSFQGGLLLALKSKLSSSPMSINELRFLWNALIFIL
jgi:hypothetical protein